MPPIRKPIIANCYKKRYDLTVNETSIRHSQGLMTGALWMLLNAFTRPGDNVLIQAPVYHTFSVVIKGAGRFVETNDLSYNDGHYEIDFEDLDRKTQNPRTRILLVCNPHNPVGRVWTKEELQKMYDICKKNNTLIISDEIHGDIVYGEHKHTPFFSLSEEVANNVIVMSSPSKTFNLACFYSAYTNEDCEAFVDQQNEYFWKNIGIVRNFLKENMPEVKLVEPEGTYLLWIDFRAWGMTSAALFIGKFDFHIRHGLFLSFR